MTEPALARSPLMSRLRLAAILMTLGLLIEVATLSSVHPFAFLTFAFLGMSLVGAAVLTYLYAIVSDR
jgi:hypothetical protein